MSCRQPIDWTMVSACLPTGKDSASLRRRKDLFMQMDPNGNGYLSLAEVDRGVLKVMDVPCLRKRAVVHRAFHAARHISPGKPGRVTDENDYIDFREFRCFLAYLRHYLELFEMFGRIDTSSDLRVSRDEFVAAVPMLLGWGAKCAHDLQTRPEAVFGQVDRDGGGQILFDEFADWAVHQALDLEDDDDVQDPDALAHLKQRRNLASAVKSGGTAARAAASRTANAGRQLFGAVFR